MRAAHYFGYWPSYRHRLCWSQAWWCRTAWWWKRYSSWMSVCAKFESPEGLYGPSINGQNHHRSTLWQLLYSTSGAGPSLLARSFLRHKFRSVGNRAALFAISVAIGPFALAHPGANEFCPETSQTYLLIHWWYQKLSPHYPFIRFSALINK